jgi:hypothetical protein
VSVYIMNCRVTHSNNNRHLNIYRQVHAHLIKNLRYTGIQYTCISNIINSKTLQLDAKFMGMIMGSPKTRDNI